MDQTLGAATELSTFAEIERIAVPSVLVVPVIAGGTVGKSEWAQFQEVLWRYVRRGGVVVVLLQAFCLQEDGQRAGGRRFEGVATHARKGRNWLPGVIEFGSGHARGARVACTRIGPGDQIPAAFGAIEVDTGHGLLLEHELVDPNVAGEACTVLAYVATGGHCLPLILRLAYDRHEWPGCILFMNTWSWMRADLLVQRRAVQKLALEHVENTFRCLRAVNRETVLSTVRLAQERVVSRLARMEVLAGANDRLRRVLGSEKDYHRLLANDPGLCVDLLCVHGTATAKQLRKVVGDGLLIAEPPHPIGDARRGRLDLLLFAPGEAVDFDTRASLDAYLENPGRKAVAWVELEAGQIHAAQMLRFVTQAGKLLRKGDFVCAVDRSPDASSDVLNVGRCVADAGAMFVHVRVPNAFDALEEAYLPTLNRLSRKRFTLEVIRALLG